MLAEKPQLVEQIIINKHVSIVSVCVHSLSSHMCIRERKSEGYDGLVLCYNEWLSSLLVQHDQGFLILGFNFCSNGKFPKFQGPQVQYYTISCSRFLNLNGIRLNGI